MQWGVVTYMTDEVKEPITLLDNKLAWFSGADLPHSQDPTILLTQPFPLV